MLPFIIDAWFFNIIDIYFFWLTPFDFFVFKNIGKLIRGVIGQADLEEVYNTERHLLYLACTRARDNLLVTGVEPCSEFLDDLKHDMFAWKSERIIV